jgi:hypothetical protein
MFIEIRPYINMARLRRAGARQYAPPRKNYRNDLNAARISVTKSSGCSRAAKKAFRQDTSS